MPWTVSTLSITSWLPLKLQAVSKLRARAYSSNHLYPTLSKACISSQQDEAAKFSSTWDLFSALPKPSPVLVKHGSQGRGLYITKELIRKHELLVSIPLSATLFHCLGELRLDSSASLGDGRKLDPADWDSWSRMFEVSLPEQPTDEGEKLGGEARIAATEPATRLAIKLITQLQNEVSFWREYSNLLPVQFDSALLWTEEELGLLQWDDAKRAALAYAERVALMASAIVEHFASGPCHVSRGHAIWALMTVLTRSFSAPVTALPPPSTATTTGTLLALVPLADMINHSPGQSSNGVVDPVGGGPAWRVVQAEDGQWRFEVRSSGEARAGEEVLISYGSKSSLEFLLNYGFVPTDNPSDELPLYNNVEHLVNSARRRLGWIRRKEQLLLSMHPSPSALFLHPGGFASELLVCLLVLYAESPGELSAIEGVWLSVIASPVSGDSSQFWAAVLAAMEEQPLLVGSSTRRMAAEHLVWRCEEEMRTLGFDRGTTEENDVTLIAVTQRNGFESPGRGSPLERLEAAAGSFLGERGDGGHVLAVVASSVGEQALKQQSSVGISERATRGRRRILAESLRMVMKGTLASAIERYSKMLF